MADHAGRQGLHHDPCFGFFRPTKTLRDAISKLIIVRETLVTGCKEDALPFVKGRESLVVDLVSGIFALLVGARLVEHNHVVELESDGASDYRGFSNCQCGLACFVGK